MTHVARAKRVATSFAIVVVAYWMYALTLVPLIEPAADLAGSEAISERDRASAMALAEIQLQQIRPLFAQGAWELDNPVILECNRAKLLLKKYWNQPDGSVKLDRCTIVFPYTGPAESEEQLIRQSVILEAPGGANLKFDKPFDLSRAKIGRLVSGQLFGEVKIRSDCKEKGPQDDLMIVTRDVQLAENVLYTPHEVNFRWGPHFGSGRQLTIELLTRKPARRESKDMPNISGMKYFELAQVDRLHLDLGGSISQTNQPSESIPVEINCRGPFRFDALKHVATFNDGVDVLKANPGGPSDQIACDTLAIYFVPNKPTKQNLPAEDEAESKTKAKKGDPGSLDLKAERIEATGRPAVLTAPSRNLVSRAQKFSYNLLENSISLQDPENAFLQQGPNEFHSKSLYYRAAAPGHIGQLMAQGPGRMTAQSPDRPQTIEACWNDKLTLVPDGQNHVISLLGGATLNCQGVGLLQAGEIFFWISETPSNVPGKQTQVKPDRMLARHNVQMNSPRLAARVAQLEAWFDNRNHSPIINTNKTPNNTSGNNIAATPGQTATPALNQPVSNQQADMRRFEIKGRLLQVKLVVDGNQVEVAHLTMADDVCLTEMQAERPLTLTGDRLEAADLMGTSGSATIIGRPAHFEDKGLGLTGSNITINRAENRLWIDGPGRMDAPLTGALPGQPTAMPGTLTISWQRRMEFNGKTALFEDSVIASTGNQQMRTASMLVQMLRPVSFMDQNPQEKPQIDEIQCRGGVFLENKAFDQQQQLAAYDRMEVTDLAVKIQSGAMTAGGPGWLNSVRRGSANLLDSSGTPTTSTSPEQLMCLHVRFQRSITGSLPPGNIWHRKLTFSDRVRMSYAPVSDWETMLSVDNPDILGPTGAVVRCEQLSVTDMPLPLGNRRSMELEALGNAVVENIQYTARGHRIAYNEVKDMLILQGDGRNDAELFMQQGVGAPPSQHAAQKIIYRPRTKQLKIENARSLQMGQPNISVPKR